MGFVERGRNVGHVPDSKGDRISIEAAVGEAQAFGIFLLPAQPIDAAFLRALHPDGQHVRIDVRDRHLRAAFRHSEGNVAGAPGHVQDLLAGTRLHAGNETVLPAAMKAGGHQIVHQIVAAGDRAEDPAYSAGLLVGAYQFVAEIDRIAHRASL